MRLPLKTVSEANRASHEHWSKRHKRAREQRAVSRLFFANKVASYRSHLAGGGGVLVSMIRIAPSSGLDDDNLRSSLKAVRDGIADALGSDDRNPKILWEYSQTRGEYGVDIDMRCIP